MVLLKRVVSRLAETYRDQIVGDGVREKMESLVRLMQERDIRFELNSSRRTASCQC